MTDKQTFEIKQSIDTSGTRCPIPLLQVLATDPSAKPDFDAMLRHLPHELVSYSTCGEPRRLDTFIIKKGA